VIGIVEECETKLEEEDVVEGKKISRLQQPVKKKPLKTLDSM